MNNIGIGDIINIILTIIVLFFSFYVFWYNKKEGKKNALEKRGMFQDDQTLKKETNDIVKNNFSEILECDREILNEIRKNGGKNDQV